MLNHIVLVGRLTENLKINAASDGKKVTSLTLAVPRTFKNIDGLYERDFIECILWNNLATNTAAYCKKGDLVGIKGRLQSSKKQIEVIAEKVTFLSTKQGK